MINQYLLDKIRTAFSLEPTSQQSALMEMVANFIVDKDSDRIFLLKGYAGTGKTSVISSVIKVMDELQQPVVLLAPTGRAAKVLSIYSEKQAFTIHKKIYRQKSGADFNSDFNLNVNLHKSTLFVVDEASMIANSAPDSVFGSGCLLDDLIHYVYSGENCRLILIGDTAQLPPVGQLLSPALDKGMLEGYGFSVDEFELTEVVRQASSSGILSNATFLRTLIANEFYDDGLPKIDTESFPDVKKMPGDELIEALSSSYGKYGTDDVIVISRSNKRANVFNNGIRNSVLYREEELSSGDMLMVVKNNYFWSKDIKGFDFIANGDVAEVKRIRNKRELYGFRFAEVLLYFPDYDTEIEANILLDTLQSPSPTLTYDDSNRLFQAVQEDYMDIGNKRDRMLKMRQDPYLNALQVKFAYAVTCHKAQGGQWDDVYIDVGYITEEQTDIEFLRWLYTAFTRARRNVYMINWRD